MIQRILVAALLLAAIRESTVGRERAFAADQYPNRPYSCRLLDDEQRKCAFGSCDRRAIERLTKECWRDGGRP